MRKSGKTMRLFLFNATVFSLIGIWLSGWDQVHWFSYLLPGAFLLAVITGFCPGLLFAHWVTGEKQGQCGKAVSDH